MDSKINRPPSVCGVEPVEGTATGTEPDWSKFQSLDHIDAYGTFGALIAEYKRKKQDGLSWITCPEVRFHLEQEQADLLNEILGFATLWEEQREECGRVPEHPGAFMTRQSPKFDKFATQAVMLAQAIESHNTATWLAFGVQIQSKLKEQAQLIEKLKKEADIADALRNFKRTNDALQKDVRVVIENTPGTAFYKHAYEGIKKELNEQSPLYLTAGEAARRIRETIHLREDYISKELRTRLKMKSSPITPPDDKRKSRYYPLPDIIACTLEFRSNAPEDERQLTEAEWQGELSPLGKRRGEILK